MLVKILLKRHRIVYISEPHNEIRLQCPNCENLQIKNFDDPKFYYNTVKQKGHCFRCELGISTQAEFFDLFHLRGREKGLSVGIRQKHQVTEKGNGESWPTPLPETIPAYKSKSASIYLQSRGLDRASIERFGILFCRSGWYANRLVVPVFNHQHKYCTFVTRTIEEQIPDDRKKYEFPRSSGISKLLYNLHFSRNKTTVWLVEGVFDAFHTFPYSVATFGKHISEKQITLLRLCGIQRVVLMWDYDAWHDTQDLWHRAITRLRKHFLVNAVQLPNPGTDPTNYSLQELVSMVRRVR